MFNNLFSSPTNAGSMLKKSDFVKGHVSKHIRKSYTTEKRKQHLGISIKATKIAQRNKGGTDGKLKISKNRTQTQQQIEK